MRFYEGHTLANTGKTRSFFNEKRLAITDEFRQKCIKKNPRYAEFFGDMKLSVTIYFYADAQKAHIHLTGNTATDFIHLAQVTISTVEYNCSAVSVSNLYGDFFYGLGFGWYLYDLVEQWALYAGYTLFIGNTAGIDQNKLIPKFEKRGWIQSNINYVNARTRNKNIWLFKVLQKVEEEDEDDGYYEDDTDSDHDEDF